MTGHIAYVGPFPFPDGNANARRVLGMAKCLAMADWHVSVSAGYLEQSAEGVLRDLAGSGTSVSYAGAGEFAGRWSALGKLARLCWIAGSRTIDWLEREPVPDAVIVYGTVFSYWRRLLKWAGRRHVPIIADIADWYSPEQMPGGRLAPPYWLNEFTTRRLVARSDAVIAISQYLFDCYAARGCRVLRIPPVLDVGDIAVLQRNPGDERMHLVYAGIPEHKDLLANVLDGVTRFDPDGRKCQLHLVGPSSQEAYRLYCQYSEKATVFHGRQRHGDTLQHIRDADFTVLLRPDRRYARAGFSTKVAESLAAGTPLITNLTGDMGDYLHDGLNAIVSRDQSPAAFADALARAAESRSRWRALRAAAETTARGMLDYRVYVRPLDAFLREVVLVGRS